MFFLRPEQMILPDLAHWTDGLRRVVRTLLADMVSQAAESETSLFFDTSLPCFESLRACVDSLGQKWPGVSSAYVVSHRERSFHPLFLAPYHRSVRMIVKCCNDF